MTPDRAAVAGLGYTADFASWTMPPGCSAGAPSAAAVPATAKASPGTGMWARSGGPAAVQRSVHDITSLQYQRMSEHAWPPSATSRPSGSAMPHKQHRATCGGHRRSHCVAGGGSADTRRGPPGSCPGTISGEVTAEACEAMIPPRGTQVTRPPAHLQRPGRPACDVIRQARSYQARSWLAKLAHTKPAHPKVATHALGAQGKAAKSLSSHPKSLRSHSHQSDLQFARPGRGDRASTRRPSVAGEGQREHHGKQDNRQADQHVVVAGPGDHLKANSSPAVTVCQAWP